MKVLAGLLLGFSSYLLVFCSGKATEIVILEEEGIIIEAEFLKGTQIKQGYYIKRDIDSKETEFAFYYLDTLHGRRILLDDFGDTIVAENYDKGLFEGVFKSFYPGNKINVIANYKNNKLEGELIRYYESGQIMEKVNFVNNEENGSFIEYYENGNLKAMGQYKNGSNEEGELSLFNENGLKSRIMFCKEGKCKTIWSIE
jgi:antitoxin component YwqK of YwqJK toxin-antitoxin module